MNLMAHRDAPLVLSTTGRNYLVVEPNGQEDDLWGVRTNNSGGALSKADILRLARSMMDEKPNLGASGPWSSEL